VSIACPVDVLRLTIGARVGICLRGITVKYRVDSVATEALKFHFVILAYLLDHREYLFSRVKPFAFFSRLVFCQSLMQVVFSLYTTANCS
jgi:hypothetical protein